MPTGSCTRNCWIAGAILGLLVWIFTAGPGSLRWFEGLILGILAAGLFGAFLNWLICNGAQAEGGEVTEPIIPAALMGKVTAAASAIGQKASDLAGGDKGEEKALAADTSDQATAAENKKAAKPQPKDETKTENKAKATTARKPAASGTTKNQPDDLKQIKGVGPKLEELLIENGITSFAQIANWNDAEQEQFAELIGRTGNRIQSDDWVGQARILADGGETEFSKRVDKGDVY